MVNPTLEHLAWLVAISTENPPRSSTGLVEKLRAVLANHVSLDVEDLGDGCINLLATRGSPRILFNVHLDTVPRNAAWTRNPLELTIEEDRAYGLGACDIKGAAAALIAAITQTKGDVAVLFTTDEEAGSSRCVRRFLAKKQPFDAVVVAEPTAGRAISAHRGVATMSGTFYGTPGHASSLRALEDSAVHEAARWIVKAVEHAKKQEIPFNAGRFEGGEKPNMIASEAKVRIGVRTEVGKEPRDVLADFQNLASDPKRVQWELGFVGPPLPLEKHRIEESQRLAEKLGLPLGNPVDFWTEAALFSAAGYPTLVYGPGEIVRAHTADEWTSCTELDRAFETYTRILGAEVS